MFEVTILIPGLMELAEALKQMCGGKDQKPAGTAPVYNGSAAPASPQAVPVSVASMPQQAAPQAVPVSVASMPQQAAPQAVPVSAPQQAQAAPVAPQMVQTPTTPQAVPTSAPAYTLDDLARAAMVLMDSGRQPDLQKLLADFGVEALPALPPEMYGAFATALRGMGAQI